MRLSVRSGTPASRDIFRSTQSVLRAAWGTFFGSLGFANKGELNLRHRLARHDPGLLFKPFSTDSRLSALSSCSYWPSPHLQAVFSTNPPNERQTLEVVLLATPRTPSSFVRCFSIKSESKADGPSSRPFLEAHSEGQYRLTGAGAAFQQPLLTHPSICDAHLPTLFGIEALERLRERKRRDAIPAAIGLRRRHLVSD